MLFELMRKIWIMSELDSVFFCRYYVFALPAHCAEFAKYGFHVGSRVGSVIGIALDIDARLILAYVADERTWIGDPADNENRVVARHALQPRYRCHFVGKNGDKMSVEIAREIELLVWEQIKVLLEHPDIHRLHVLRTFCNDHNVGAVQGRDRFAKASVGE